MADMTSFGCGQACATAAVAAERGRETQQASLALFTPTTQLIADRRQSADAKLLPSLSLSLTFLSCFNQPAAAAAATLPSFLLSSLQMGPASPSASRPGLPATATSLPCRLGGETSGNSASVCCVCAKRLLLLKPNVAGISKNECIFSAT
jgi:hypothetical protein